MKDNPLPIVMTNRGAIFSENLMRVGFSELLKAASIFEFDYLAAEIRLHPAQKPLLVEAASPGNIVRGDFAGMRVFEDASMPDDEIHVRDRDGKLLIRITNLGKIRESGE